MLLVNLFNPFTGVNPKYGVRMWATKKKRFKEKDKFCLLKDKQILIEIYVLILRKFPWS